MRGVTRSRRSGAVVEGLEGRRLFAAGYGSWVSPADTIIDFNGGAVRFTPTGFGHVIVAGTDGDDTIKVSRADGGGMLVEINGQSQVFHHPSGEPIRGAELWGYGGNDHLEVDIVESGTGGMGMLMLWNDLRGGDGDDTLVGADVPGTFARDNLYGDAGNDTLISRNGNDMIMGGLGDDVLTGGDGTDELWGNGQYGATPQSGDVLDGGAGGDTFEGVLEQAPDYWEVSLGGGRVYYKESMSWAGPTAAFYVYGTEGDDVIRVHMDSAQDAVYFEINGQTLRVENAAVMNQLEFGIMAMGGNDHVENNMTAAQVASFNTGSMSIYGGAGDDVLFGSGGRDNIYGEDQSFFAHVSAANDVLHGRDGNDDLYVYGAGSVAYGGAGMDNLYRNEDWEYDDLAGRWAKVYGSADGLHGETGVDTINGVAETYDAARDFEPAPDPEPVTPAMTPAEVVELSRFVGPLPAETYDAWTAALASLVTAPAVSWAGTVTAPSPSSASDWLSLAGATLDDEESLLA